MGNRLLVARDEISGRVARYDYDEVDNLISAEYERGGEVERLYRVSDRMGNLFETRERDDRRYDAGGRLAEDREHFYHYDCEGNLVFKEFKEMVLHGGIVAPINKERLETELGIRFRAFGTGWRYDWQSDGMLARVVRPTARKCRSPTTPSAAASENLLQERPRSSFGTATFRCTSGRKLQLMPERQMSPPGYLSRTRLFQLPSSLPTARASPSYLITSALPCRHLTITATRYGSRSLTSTDDSGNAPLRSYRSSTRDNMRIRRRDFIIIGSATTPQGLEHTSAKTQLG